MSECLYMVTNRTDYYLLFSRWVFMTSKRSYSLWSFWFYKNKMVNLVQLNKCELKVTFSECVAAVAPSDPCNLIKAVNRFTLLCSVSKSVEPMANIYFHCAVVWLMCLTSLAHVELRLYSTSAPETRIPPPPSHHTPHENCWKPQGHCAILSVLQVSV